jgi:hypothetical protein
MTENRTEISDGEPAVLSELVPVDATDEEREAAEDRAGQLLANLQPAGHDVRRRGDAGRRCLHVRGRPLTPSVTRRTVTGVKADDDRTAAPILFSRLGRRAPRWWPSMAAASARRRRGTRPHDPRISRS